jgi:hypothetical protein
MTTIQETAHDAATGDSRWYAQPMRWLQLNLVPDDALHADIGQWRRYWEDARVEGLTLSAAGATAFYPTDIPLHPRAAQLGSRDLLGELVGAAKELGIRVLARFEASVTTQELGAAHPDWIAQRAGTATIEFPGMDAKASAAFVASFFGGRPSPCFNGPYFREFMPQVMTELATRYPIDGFYANGWPYIGGGPPSPAAACSCPSCLAGWHARGHDDYPVKADPDDPVWNDFVTYVQESYEDVQRLWQRHVKSIRPGLSFVCNLHGSLASGLRWGEFGPLVDLFANDSQGRHTLEPAHSGVASQALWSASRSAAVLNALADGKPTFHIVGGWHAGSPPLRRMAKEPLEIRMMLAQVVARGARPWCNVAGATIYDRRWMEPIREYYAWHAGVEPYFRNERSAADVGIVWTPRALWPEWSDRQFTGDGPSMASAFHGWHETLLRARQPFDIVPDFRMTDEAIARYRALIVPSGSTIDLETATSLRRFVQRGGGLVLGCGTLKPAHGDAGGEGILAELAGVGVPGTPTGPRASGYIEITTTRDHLLLRGVGDTDYLPAGTWCALPPSVADARGAGRYQHPLPFLADLAFVEREPPDDPPLTQRGQCVYLATDLDALHGAQQLPDVRRLLVNSLEAAHGGRPARCRVSGPGIVDVNVWEQAASTTVHLVNFTNAHLYGGPIDELTPIGPQTIELRVEPNVAIERVRLLRAGVDVNHERAPDGTITVVVPGIDDFEVVAIDRTAR